MPRISTRAARVAINSPHSFRPGPGGFRLIGRRPTVIQSALPVGDVLLQAVIVVPGLKTPEGTLIEAVAPFWFEFIEMMNKDPSVMYQLSPRQWEEMIAAAYHRAGFEDVILTPRSGDHGRDIIAVKKGICEVRIIDQVKAYKPGHLVDADDVRALMGILPTDGASKACLTTTSGFAPQLKADRASLSDR